MYHFGGDTDFQAAPDVTTQLSVGQASQVVTIPNPPLSATFGTPFTLTPKSATTAKIDLAATNASVVDNHDGSYTLKPTSGTDIIVVTATQEADKNHPASPAVAINIAATKALTKFSNLVSIPEITFGDHLTLNGLLAAGTLFPAGKTITIALGKSTVSATITADGTFTTTPAIDTSAFDTGSYPITYAFAGDLNFQNTSDSKSSALKIDSASQVVSFSNPPSSATFDQPFKLTPLSATPSKIDLVATNASVKDNLDGSYTFTPTTGTGSIQVTAIQEADKNHNVSDAKMISILATKATASVTLSALSGILYDGKPHAAIVTTVPGGLNTQISYTPGPGAPTEAGSYAVAALIDNPNYSGQKNDTLVISAAKTAFSNLTPTSSITSPQSTVTLGGTLAAPTAVPTGQAVTITVGSITATATIGSDGSFSAANLNISALVSGTYGITFSFAKTNDFEGATDGRPPASRVSPQSRRRRLSARCASSSRACRASAAPSCPTSFRRQRSRRRANSTGSASGSTVAAALSLGIR